jgi:hypothetical protein
MNTQESKLLEGFLGQLVEVPSVQKDRAAAAAIDRAFERQPDAAYLVVQRALLLQQALEASQAEVAQLKGEGAAPKAGGFLDSSAWGRRPAPASAGVSPAAARRGSLSGAGSFLGQAAATAAGVAGGAFLFQGLNNLLRDDSSAVASADAGAAQTVDDGSWSTAETDVDAGFDGGDFTV